MAPLSFEPAADATYRSSVFSQYPAALLGEQNITPCIHLICRISLLVSHHASCHFSEEKLSEEKLAESKSQEDVPLSYSILQRYSTPSFEQLMFSVRCVFGLWWEADTWAVLSSALSVTSPPYIIRALWWPRRIERNRHGQIRSRHSVFLHDFEWCRTKKLK